MKALTVPNVLDGTNSSLMEANDLFLLFLCPIDYAASFPCDRVVLYLHLLGTGEGTKYSVPYRVLTFDYDEFVRGVVVNGCVMPRRFFFARLHADLVNDNLIVRAPNVRRHSSNNGKTMFSALYMRTASELEDYYRSVYDDVGDRAFQMYLMAFYYFYYGTDRSFCAVGAVFEKFYEDADDEKIDPTVRYPTLSYLARRCARVSFQTAANENCHFRQLVTAFFDRSLEMYATLNEISKQYRHEDTAGVVANYAMAKSFKGMTAKEYVDRSERYEQMVKTFAELIVYHDRAKFDQLAEELLSGSSIVDVELGSVKYCMLMTFADPLFGLNTNRFEFTGRLEKALFYGWFPRPCMDLKPTSILCEMMGGSQRDGEYASELVLGLHAYRPVLSRCEGGDYRILTLNGRNVDRPIPQRIVELVERHVERPNISSYLDYCGELLHHVARCRYFYHETVNPFMPIFTINADLDVYDRTFVREYYSGDDQWTKKRSLFIGLKNLVLHVCCSVLKLPVDEANTTFFLYESVRDDLRELETSKRFKLGLRLVVKFETIVFEDRTVVDSFLWVLNIYRPLFLHRLDDDPFDCAIYGRPHHDIRLPLNMKPDGSKALLPVLFECHRHNFLQALKMTSSLVHVRNGTTRDAIVKFVRRIKVPTDETLEKFDGTSVCRELFLAKRKVVVEENHYEFGTSPNSVSA